MYCLLKKENKIAYFKLFIIFYSFFKIFVRFDVFNLKIK